MKKTLTINLNGIVFHIDEDAYERLDIYLNKLNKYYLKITEGKEIMADIEARMAELFDEKLIKGSNVITIEMVKDAISIMGEVEELIDDDNLYEEEKLKEKKVKHKKVQRRFYRNPDSKIFGGIAGGLSAYFDIDVVLLRTLLIVFTILGYGLILIVYIVLWIVTPIAETTSQKLEMKGININISNIEKVNKV